MVEDQRNLCRFSYLAYVNFEPSKMKLALVLHLFELLFGTARTFDYQKAVPKIIDHDFVFRLILNSVEIQLV